MREVPGARLSFFGQVWRRYGASPEVLKTIEKGHKIEFEYGNPPLSVPNSEFETKLMEEDQKVVRDGIQELLQKETIRIVSIEEAIKVPGFYSKVFARLKPGTNKYRMIINMKPLNEFIEVYYKREIGRQCPILKDFITKQNRNLLILYWENKRNCVLENKLKKRIMCNIYFKGRCQKIWTCPNLTDPPPSIGRG